MCPHIICINSISTYVTSLITDSGKKWNLAVCWPTYFISPNANASHVSRAYVLEHPPPPQKKKFLFLMAPSCYCIGIFFFKDSTSFSRNVVKIPPPQPKKKKTPFHRRFPSCAGRSAGKNGTRFPHGSARKMARRTFKNTSLFASIPPLKIGFFQWLHEQ